MYLFRYSLKTDNIIGTGWTTRTHLARVLSRRSHARLFPFVLMLDQVLPDISWASERRGQGQTFCRSLVTDFYVLKEFFSVVYGLRTAMNDGGSDWD